MGDGGGSEVTADEAFAQVANKTRFDIIEALWEASQSGEAPVSFSDLRDRTGIADSGQFNYHLGELVPRFVRDTEEGYALTYAGRQVIGAAVSGIYTDTERTHVDAISVGTCLLCDGQLEAQYAEGRMIVECGDCGLTVTDGLGAPPVVAAGHDRENLPAVFNRFLISSLQTTIRGFCGICSGRVDVSVIPPDEIQSSPGPDGEQEEDDSLEFFTVRTECQECGQRHHGVVGPYLLDHPAVIGFLYDAGIDIRESYLWELDWLFEPHAKPISEDPLRLEVTIEAEGETLTLTVDDSLQVVDHEPL